jgi:hypothetical protein
MATTIRSTQLDFDTIKSNLKTYLQAQDEFTDYDFEASGLSNILDVLAYNTHYNGLIANFALNESFLGTAQLRPSVVALSEALGYIPDSVTTSRGQVKLALTIGAAGRPATIQLNEGVTFTTSVDDTTYTFQTLDDLEAIDDGSGYYLFKTSAGSENINIYEGTLKTKTFIVGPYEENVVYVIPEKNMDIRTATVKVYETTSSSSYTTYKDIIDATTINASSTLYILKESPNGYYELTFGDGNALGVVPAAGNKIEVDYLVSSGAVANTATAFAASNTVTVNSVAYPLSVTTVTRSASGSAKESIESIRKNAPFQYATQNRMVTAEDYKALVLRNFSQLIADINAWGGEDNLEPQFGITFYSIRFNADVSQTIIDATKQSIRDLANDLSVVSFGVDFADPVYSYVEGDIFFRFNDKLTPLSKNTTESNVRSVVSSYFSDNLGLFKRAFRRSNLLSLVDDTDVSVLSSRADIRLNQRFEPTLTAVRDYNLRFPSPIARPDDENYIINSTTFVYNGDICVIKNKLSSTILQVVRTADDSIAIDNLGSYTAATGVVNIVGFNPDSITSGDNYIKLVVTPANQSAIEPTRNDVLLFDNTRTVVRSVPTTATN